MLDSYYVKSGEFTHQGKTLQCSLVLLVFSNYKNIIVLLFVISDPKHDQDEVKEDEKEDIKKQLIDDEEEDRKLLEAIPDESENTNVFFFTAV